MGMKCSRYLRLLLAFLMGMPGMARAGHIIGGELYYDHLGGNQYRIYLTLYRDCSPGSTGFDAQASIGVFGANGTVVGYFNAPYTGEQQVAIVVNNPCLTAPPNICLRTTTYTVQVNLPPTTAGYTITYQRCCRLPAISNLFNAQAQGLTCTARIPGQPHAANSSARFATYPPVVLCLGDNLTFDHVATDADGDSLAYKFCTPYHGGSQADPAPLPYPPPYTNVPWAAGYNVDQQINSSPPMSIDPVTGLLTVSPTQLGYYVMGVCVEEYRNGVLINTDLRDVMFAVVTCDPSIQAVVADQTPQASCQGLTQQFFNASINGGFWAWDFGDPTTDQDTSSLENPSWTYAAPGTYEVMLVANPGWTCADTAYATYTVQEPIQVSFTPPPTLCGTGELTLTATGNFSSNAIVQWTLPPTAVPNNGVGPQISAVFQPLGAQPVTLNVTDGVCTASHTANVVVQPEVTAAFAPQTVLCEGLTVSPQNLSTGTTSFAWDFGDPTTTADASTEANPTWTYATQGTYTITLVADPGGACADTTTQVYHMYTDIHPMFERPAIACPGEEVLFLVSGNLTAFGDIQWDFGTVGTPAQATGAMASAAFGVPGVHPVTVTVVEHGCTGTYADSVVVHPRPVANFTSDDEACVGTPFQFTDGSTALTPLRYRWYFGDGTSATSPHPLHNYLLPGVYDVALVVATDSGCVATDSLMVPAQVTVHPPPVAGFSVHPPVVSIHAGHIAVTDHAVGAVEWTYFIEDDIYTVAEPTHLFTEGGHHNVVQVVTTAYGCTDTLMRPVFVRGHLFYAPTAFTPDGDDVNDMWLPIVRGAQFYELWIHDRWGRLVFNTRDPEEGWSGDGQAPGVYIYQARLKEWGSDAYEYTGHFTLLR